MEDVNCKARNDTSYKQWSCHSGYKLQCKLCQNLPPRVMGAWTNPDPTNTHKQVWICDICHKQIYSRNQISIRCSRIEHWVHLRCAGIHQAKYTDTWTCHLHRESRLTLHTNITALHPSRPWSNPLPTSHLHHPHHRSPNTDTRPTIPLFPQDW